MTRRDLGWRLGGLALLAAAGAMQVAVAPSFDDRHAAWGLLSFLLAVVGTVLLIQGRRVALAIRIERGRHRYLPPAIHARRRRDAADATSA